MKRSNRPCSRTTAIAILALTTAVCAARAEEVAAAKPPAPLFDGLGHLHHPITTRSKAAQRYFDQGLLLCYAFNHREAIRSFRAAAGLDPDCAMAWWGVAYALGPHVNKPMNKEDNDQAWAAVKQARALRDKASPWEQAYVDAVAQRYSEAFPEDRSPLDRAWAGAMREVVRQFPDDTDARVIFAEALMNTMPWDYWTKDRSPKPEIEEAFAAVRHVIAQSPDHPGANHLHIHLVEAGPNPESGLPSADRLAFYAPQAGHLVHMPSHIYMRVGQYHDAVLANERAMEADRSYLSRCRAEGFYPGVYYPHNIHFLWWAQTFEGRSADALQTANRAADYARDNSCGPNQVLEGPRLRHLPWLTLARFGRWEEILKLPEPPGTNDFLVDRALWHFTRGLAFSAQENTGAAELERARMAALVDSDAARKLNNPNFPVTDTLAIAVQCLSGKVAGAKGDHAAMIESLKQAVAAEDALPYMEPTFWPFPIRPVLGAALLRSGDPVAAELVFREDIKRWPRNPWGLLGLEQSLRKQGKEQAADLVRVQFNESWKRGDVPLALAWF